MVKNKENSLNGLSTLHKVFRILLSSNQDFRTPITPEQYICSTGIGKLKMKRIFRKQ